MEYIKSICLLDNLSIAVAFVDDDEIGTIIPASLATTWIFEADEDGDLDGVEIGYESDHARSAWFKIGIDA